MTDYDVSFQDKTPPLGTKQRYRDLADGTHAPQVLSAGLVHGDEKTFSIGLGANGSAVAMTDLGKPYAFLLVRCEDADGIDASSTISAQVAFDAADTACTLYENNDPGTQWSKSVPATGTFAFSMWQTFGYRHIRFVLSKVTTAQVVIKMRGVDQLA